MDDGGTVNLNLCVYCGGYSEVRDHVIPRAAGGNKIRNNLVPSCRPCNSTASDWVFENIEDKRRYILLRRFYKRSIAVEFRERVNAYRASSVKYAIPPFDIEELAKARYGYFSSPKGSLG